MQPRSSYPTITDQFCGAGGSSIGASKIIGRDGIRLAMNHNPIAIETHNANFPDTVHARCDIQSADPKRFPTTDILITSPECTNHSLAKGARRKGLAQMDMFNPEPINPDEERSRATMWDVPRFAEHHQYRYIVVENVVDARMWALYPAWIQAMELLGYRHKVVYFNSQFAYPTPQSRDRLYAVFWKQGEHAPDLDFHPIGPCPEHGDIECHQAWKNPEKPWGKYGPRHQYIYVCPQCLTPVEPYRFPAWTVIDWALPTPKIGDRAKPLSANTMSRIAAGIKKYWTDPQPFVADTAHSHASHSGKLRSADDPLPTQTSQERLGLAIPPFLTILKGNPTDRTAAATTRAVDDTFTTFQSNLHHGMVVPPEPFMVVHKATQGTDDAMLKSVDEAFNTFATTGSGQHSVVTPPESDQTTWTAHLPQYLMPFLLHYYGRLSAHSHVGEVMPTVTPDPRFALVNPPLIMCYGRSGSNWATTNEAMPTFTSKQRHALVDPTEIIGECGYRMLTPDEIKLGMAFPSDYIVRGNKGQQVTQYGQAVTPPVMEMLIQRVITAMTR